MRRHLQIAGLAPMDIGRMMEAVANPFEVTKTVKLALSMVGGLMGSNPLGNLQQAVEQVRTTLLWGHRRPPLRGL